MAEVSLNDLNTSHTGYSKTVMIRHFPLEIKLHVVQEVQPHNA